MEYAESLGLLGPSTATLTQWLDMWGYVLVALFVAIESSGIPFPGETMLLVAAVYAGSGNLSIEWVIAAAALGAILGDNAGYLAGRYGGRPLAQRFGRYIRLRDEHLDRAEEYFRRHGDKTVFFGRHVAVLRAWAAFFAGMNRMPWQRFLFFNASGGIIWAVTYGMLGYLLGNNLPLLDRVIHFLGIAGVVAAVVIAATAFILWKRGQRKKRALSREAP